MNIQHDISLKPFNSFGMEALAKRFVSVASLAELKAVIAQEKDILPLGGGSNLLITKDIQQLVVKIDLRGIVVEERPDDYVLVTVAAGENWHDFVSWCISQEYGGLENLSLIPGNVGSAPIQNIGAYGVELKDTLDHLNAVESASGNSQTFSR
ncbi:MAG: FAD-binding protein, partial [Lutibacter sp.]|nr:FAD-binding protein [Lutibacter sp.]